MQYINEAVFFYSLIRYFALRSLQFGLHSTETAMEVTSELRRINTRHIHPPLLKLTWELYRLSGVSVPQTKVFAVSPTEDGTYQTLLGALVPWTVQISGTPHL